MSAKPTKEAIDEAARMQGYPRRYSLDWWCKWFVLVATGPLIVFLIIGCGTTEEYARAGGEQIVQLEPIIRRVEDSASACTAIRAKPHSMGCSDPWGRVVKGRCLIIVPLDDPGWIEEHERLHCKYGRFHSKRTVFTQDCAYPS